MKRLIVLDLDGTLLQPDLSISPKTKSVWKAIEEQGHVITLASGRPEQLMKEYVDKLGITTPIISSNGSVIGNPFQEDKLSETGLSKDTINYVLSYVKQHDIKYMIYTKDAILCQENDRSRFFEKRNKSLSKRQRSIFVYDKDRLENLDDTIVYKILIIEEDKTVYDQVMDYVQNIDDATVIQSQSHFIDINPKGVSKGKALKVLAEYHQIPLSQTIAFGDHHNDIEMIQTAGTGIAMGNAVDALQDVADDVALIHTEDGVAVWLEEHVLQQEQSNE